MNFEELFEKEKKLRIGVEKNLHEAEEKFRLISENSQDIISLHDTSSKYFYVSPSIESILGYKSDELLNKKMYEFIHPEDRKKIERSFKRKYLKGSKNLLEEFRLQKKDGTYIWIESLISYVYVGKELKQIIANTRDITSRKQLETDLREANKLAEVSSEAKKQFLANMSHELRTPMNAIYGLSNLLSKTKLDNKQRSYVESLITSSKNLSGIIEDILDFSKIDSGKINIVNKTFQLSELSKQLFKLIDNKAEKKGLELFFEIDPKINDVLISDPRRIFQALVNLLNNAIKYTEKGTVRFACKLLSETKTENLIEFSVTDTGIGIPKEKTETIFESFSQGDNKDRIKLGGAGLGLSITKQLVDLLGGKIFIDSKKNKGTWIGFTLNFKKGNEKDIVTGKEFEPGELLKGKRILVAEDNEINLSVVLTMIENWGIVSDTAVNGIEVIEKLKNNKYDLILMDVRMPEMNGLETTRVIRNSFDKNIPIIAMTANALKGDSEECIAAGMNDYLSKPFEELDLFLKICKAFEINTEEIIISELKPDSSQENIFSIESLEQIAKGNTDFIFKMLSMFVAQVPDSIKEIREAMKEKDYEKVKGIVHKLKPSVMILKINSLITHINTIEEVKDFSDAKNISKINSSVKELETILLKVVEEIQHVISLTN